MAKSELEKDFEDYTMTIEAIADKHGMEWDAVQKQRLRYRKAHGLPTKQGLTRPAESTAAAVLALEAEAEANGPFSEQFERLINVLDRLADTVARIYERMDRDYK